MIPLAFLAVLTLDAASIAQNTATFSALGPHPFGSPRNGAAAEFLAAKLKESGLVQTSVDPFNYEGADGVNVVANLPGRTDRILILATHHDTRKDSTEIADRSRSLALLIEIGRQASRLRPAKTWIIASFDGGESKGEGTAHYLETLGKSRSLVEGIVFVDAGPAQNAERPPTLVAPVCPSGPAPERSTTAGRDLVSAALGGIPDTSDVSFDDPGISLLTQPFMRLFKTACDPSVARALSAGLGSFVISDESYSRTFLRSGAAEKSQDEAKLKDNAAVRLGDAALSSLQGIDAQGSTTPSSTSWLVLGRSVFSGMTLFLIGLATLVPGLLAARSRPIQLAFRAVYSLVFSIVLFSEPEIALFAGLIPNLIPIQAPRAVLLFAFSPLLLLLSAGALGFLRGQVSGTWLSGWECLGLGGAFTLLCLAPSGGKKPAAAKSKRGKK